MYGCYNKYLDIKHKIIKYVEVKQKLNFHSKLFFLLLEYFINFVETMIIVSSIT